MPKCEICNATQVKTYECKECGTNFCVSCGKSHKKICKDCLTKKGSSGSPLSVITGLFRAKK